MEIKSILLTPSEAAMAIKMGRAQLIKLAKAGKAPCIVLPDEEIRFDEDDLRSWVRNHKRPMNEESS